MIMHLKAIQFPGSHGFDGLAFPTFINWAFDDRCDFDIKAFMLFRPPDQIGQKR